MYLCTKLLNFGVLFLQHTNLLIFGNFYLKSLNCFYTKNQHNTKELPYYLPLPTIEKRVF